MDGQNVTANASSLYSTADPFNSRFTPTQDNVLGVYLVIIGIGSIFLNVTNLRILFQNRHILKPPDLFLSNVMISDLLLTFSTFPIAISSLFNHRWVGGHASCQAYGFLSYLFGYTSLMAVMMLAVVRYIFVCKSAAVKQSLTKEKCILIMLGLFAMALSFALFPFSPYASYGPEIGGVSCSLEWMLKNNIPFVTVILVFTFLGPMCVMTLCHILIIIEVQLQEKKLIRHRFTGNPDYVPEKRSVFAFLFKKNVPADIQLARLACLMWLSFTACWLPYAVISYVIVFSPPDYIPPIISILPATFCKTTVVLNPLIYVAFSKKYRERWAKSLKCINDYGAVAVDNQVYPSDANTTSM